MDHLWTGLAILDHDGVIVCVNSKWNAMDDTIFAGERHRLGANYLEFCESLSGVHAAMGRLLAQSIREVLTGLREAFRFHHAVPSPNRTNHFLLHGSRTALPASAGILLAKRGVRRKPPPAMIESADPAKERLANLRRIVVDVGQGEADLRKAASAMNGFLTGVSAAMRNRLDCLQQSLNGMTKHRPALTNEAERSLATAIHSADELVPLVAQLAGLVEGLGVPSNFV